MAITVPVAAVLGALAGAGISRWLNTNRWRRDDEPGTTRVSPLLGAAALAAVSGVVVACLGRPPWWPAAVAAVALAWLGMAVVVIDSAVQRVPEPLVLATYAVELSALTVGAAVTGQWGSWARALGAGAVVWVLAFGYSLLTGTGFGDVQLMGLAGLVLGWVGWAPALMAGVVVLAAGGVWAVVLLLRGHHRRGTFPLGPALMTGVLATVVLYTWPGVA